MRKYIAAIVVASLAMTTIGLADAEHNGSKTGSAPASLRITDPVSNEWLATLGATACQPASGSLPGFCSSAAIGGGIFDVSDLNADGKSQAVLRGTLTVEVLSCNPCGTLNFSIGNDRDDDGSVTNIDALEEDGTHNHSTSQFFDDQWADDDFGGSVGPGDSESVNFCFAHDSEVTGHEWDSYAVFLRADADSPTVGSVKVTLSGVTKVGDSVTSAVCGASYYDDTNGKL